MNKCWYCGQDVGWIGDFMESEIEGGDVPFDKDRVVSYYSCQHCGSDYEFRQGRKENY